LLRAGFSGMNRFNTGEYSKFKNSLIASYLAVSRVSKNVSIRDRDGLESVKMMSGIIGREIQKCSSFAEVDEIEIKKLFIFWRYRLSLFIRHAQ
jgi:hypothetical protein